MAIGAMVACKQLDLDIPAQVAIVGFDDIALASLLVPALTTIRVRQYEMGRMASELLLEWLAGNEAPQKHVLFPVELIVRSSCGARQMSNQQIVVMLEHLLDSDLVDLYPCESDQGAKAD
jgi:LacI family transcriptional regulator